MTPVCMYVKYVDAECTAVGKVFPCPTCPAHTTTQPTEDATMTTRSPFTAAAIAIVAAACHEANRQHCQSIGDDSQPSWDDAPDWQKDSAIAGVTAIADGTITTPEESHESWSAQKLADGWVYGPVKDPAKKEHPCLVPYDELPPEQREKDSIFFATATAKLEELVRGPAAADTIDDGGHEALSIAEADETVDLASPPQIDEAPAPVKEIEVPAPSEPEQRPPSNPLTGADVARSFAEVPSHIQFPEETLPVGTEIEKTPTGFLFKLPGRPAANGHGRTIAAALIDAQLI